MIIRSRIGSRSRIFRRRISVGFAAVASLCFLISVISFHALRTVIEAKDRVISDYAHNLLSARELEVFCEQEVSSSRAYLLTRDADFETKALRSRREFSEAISALRAQMSETEKGLLAHVMDAEKAHWNAMEIVIKGADGDHDLRSLSQRFENTVMPKRDELREAFRALIEFEELQLETVLRESSRAAKRMSILVLVIAIPAVLVAGGLFALSRRTLRRLATAEQEVHDLNQTLEGRVADRTAELTRSVRELEGFAYSVAHDLRAPLRAMSGLSQFMVEDFGKDLRPPGPEYLGRIGEAAQRMDKLIVDLLDYSRLSYSNIELRPVDVDGIVAAAVKALESDISKRSAVVEIAQGLGQAIASEPLLRQIVENLISNAIKFVGPGIAPRVRVWTDPRPGLLRIWVSDNGIGIPSEYRERIFGVFQRLNRAEDFPGTGIGLAIVRKAVEQMGGQVGLESEPGKGSKFWVDLRTASNGN